MAAGAAWRALDALTPRQRRTVLASLATLQATTPRPAATISEPRTKGTKHG